MTMTLHRTSLVLLAAVAVLAALLAGCSNERPGTPTAPSVADAAAGEVSTTPADVPETYTAAQRDLFEHLELYYGVDMTGERRREVVRVVDELCQGVGGSYTVYDAVDELPWLPEDAARHLAFWSVGVEGQDACSR